MADPAASAVIRSTCWHEITQERTVLAMKNLWPSVVLSEIYSVHQGRLERGYPQPTFARGTYRIGLACAHETGSMYMSEGFVVTIEAAAGPEYVPEHVGTVAPGIVR